MVSFSRQRAVPSSPWVARRVARAVSLLGCALTVQATPAAAQTRSPVPPSRAAVPTAPPWSEASGSSPLPLARARVTYPPVVRHPAIHGAGNGRAQVKERLFPRVPDQREQRRLREDAMRRHPAGKGGRECSDIHRVQTGESLWAIAEDHLSSGDVGTISDLVKRLYRQNKGTIGGDPDVILPGQVIDIPRPCGS